MIGCRSCVWIEVNWKKKKTIALECIFYHFLFCSTTFLSHTKITLQKILKYYSAIFFQIILDPNTLKVIVSRSSGKINKQMKGI